jgi:SAM-dependent methyltransferase
MRQYTYALDYDDPVLAELYDQQENYADDLHLLLDLLGDEKCLEILEPFSGTGRLLIPLALGGHRVKGIEIAASMAERAQEKLKHLTPPAGATISMTIGDALTLEWGEDFDVIVLGSNCLYELGSAEQQELCIQKASKALRSGGHLFVDNDNYQGDWGRGPFPEERIVLKGMTTGGIYGQLLLRTLSFDEEAQVLSMERVWLRRGPGSSEETDDYRCSKRPVSGEEVQAWIEKGNYCIECSFGNRAKGALSRQSERAIFWARRR